MKKLISMVLVCGVAAFCNTPVKAQYGHGMAEPGMGTGVFAQPGTLSSFFAVWANKVKASQLGLPPLHSANLMTDPHYGEYKNRVNASCKKLCGQEREYKNLSSLAESACNILCSNSARPNPDELSLMRGKMLQHNNEPPKLREGLQEVRGDLGPDAESLLIDIGLLEPLPTK